MSKLEELTMAAARVRECEPTDEHIASCIWASTNIPGQTCLCLESTRAVVEAMREPSDAMLEPLGNGEAYKWSHGVWTIMCDAILAEAPETNKSADRLESRPAHDGGGR